MLRRSLLIVGLLTPCASAGLEAQSLGAGLRAGAGWDGTGEEVWAGQLELVEFGRWSSVEVGLGALEGGRIEDYARTVERRTHEYHEETHVRGLALTASLLIAHPPKDSRGPYVLLGLGLGPIDVDWRADSPTDLALGQPLTGGGSFRSEGAVLAGSLASAGLGMRVHRNLDLRAQALALVVPSTDAREEMKMITTLTLTAGLLR